MNFSDIKSNIQITNPKENIWVVKVINKISYFGRFLKYCKQNKARFSKEKDGLIFKYDPVDILSKFEIHYSHFNFKLITYYSHFNFINK